MILTRDGKEIAAIYRQDGSEVEDVKDANGRLVYLASREITGTLPISFTSRGKPLSDYLISGNTVQDGTPTPEAPVDVVGCGVRTGNLWNAEISYANMSNHDGSFTGSLSSFYNVKIYPFSNGDIGKTFTVSCHLSNVTSTNVQWRAVINGTNVNGNALSSDGVLIDTFTVQTASDYIFINYGSGGSNSITLSECMLVEGSAVPTTYIPYGYKLPLTIGGTEYPIYLGQVPTTRKIKKLVLTGEEDWDGSAKFRISLSGQIGTIAPICTHYRGVTTAAYVDLANGRITVNGAYNSALAIYDIANQSSLTAWKSYLATQYAAGTPVTVWYVLAEPETAVVNEPLMKIGDYADTISMAQAGVTIPTVSGSNVLDATSAVKPSKVYIKGRGIKPIGNGG